MAANPRPADVTLTDGISSVRMAQRTGYFNGLGPTSGATQPTVKIITAPQLGIVLKSGREMPTERPVDVTTDGWTRRSGWPEVWFGMAGGTGPTYFDTGPILKIITAPPIPGVRPLRRFKRPSDNIELIEMAEGRPSLEAEFVNDEGDVLTRENILLFVRHENADVERVEDGFIVEGERYTRRGDREG